MASHYDHQNVALLLLDKGASPHATAKNGHTPLHIAARKNQVSCMREKCTVVFPLGLKMVEYVSALRYSFRNEISSIISPVQPEGQKQF